MPDIQQFTAMLLAPKGMAFWLVTLVAGVVASAALLLNVHHRDAVDDALKAAARALVRSSSGEGPPQAGMRDPCKLELETLLQSKALVPPERVWCYDKAYLDAFIAATSATPRDGGKSVLERYIRPTLIWNDIIFAIALALFTALFAIGVAPYLWWKPWSDYLMLFFAVMGLLYGVADVAEDWKLKTILDPATPVDADEANMAKWLTRAKLVTITLSGIGGAMFGLLQLAAKLLR